MRINGVSYSDASISGLDNADKKRIGLKKILSNLTDEQKNELKDMIKNIQKSGSEADIELLFSNASNKSNTAFSGNGVDLSNFQKDIQNGVQSEGAVSLSLSPEEFDSGSGARLQLSNFTKVKNVISSLSDDGKGELLNLLKQASLIGGKTGASDLNLTGLLSHASDEIQDAFALHGLDLAAFIQKSADQHNSTIFNNSAIFNDTRLFSEN